MNPSFFSFAFIVVAASIPISTGCAADEMDTRAAYPQPVGVTAPSERRVADTQGLSPPVDTPTAPEGVPPVAPALAAEPDGADAYADSDPSAVTDFRPALDPYGTWVDDPTYGTVWVPSEAAVGGDFTPYVSGGRWAYDDDYTWVSDYSWGWAPFHYGRWVYSRPGWAWIPGRSYAGAWVTWRYGEGGYVGWAPMAPTWGWRGGRAVGLGFAPRMPYAFVGTRDLFAPAVRTHILAGPQVAVVAGQTRPWIPASPAVSVGFRASVGGPPPSVLNVPRGAIVAVEPRNPLLVQARAFARPSTAVAWGAHPPEGRALVRAAPAAIAQRPTFAQPYVGGPPNSHFGGRLGGGFSGSVASVRPPMIHESPYGAMQRQAPPARPFGAATYAPAVSSPSYRGASGAPYPSNRWGYSGAPVAHPAATMSSPSPPPSPRPSVGFGGGSHGGFAGGGGHGGHGAGHR